MDHSYHGCLWFTLFVFVLRHTSCHIDVYASFQAHPNDRMIESEVWEKNTDCLSAARWMMIVIRLNSKPFPSERGRLKALSLYLTTPIESFVAHRSPPIRAYRSRGLRIIQKPYYIS